MASTSRKASIAGRLDPLKHLVTVGISCESCHFGGREHAVNGQPIRFAPASPLLKLTPHDTDRPVTGARRDPAAAAEVNDRGA